MNILDYLAKRENSLFYSPLSIHRKAKMKRVLTQLAKTADITIADIADANNLGECEDWDEVIEAVYKKQENGERICINGR